MKWIFMVHKQSGIRCYIMSYERRFIMKKFVKVCLVGGVAAFCGCTEVEVPEQSLEDQFVSMICEYESPAELPVMKWESKSDYKIVFS